MNELAQEALKAAKRTIDDLAALWWPDMYSYEAVERATQRVDVAAVADTLQLIVSALKAPVAEPVAIADQAMGTPTSEEARRPEQSDDRMAFEARFPVPDHLWFSDDQNAYLSREECEASHQPGAWITCSAWNTRWEGWQAALQSKEPK